MLIRSQNKEHLIECRSFSVTRNFGGGKKSAIIGYIDRGWWSKETTLGLYDTKEAALEELSRLQTEIANDAKIYEMR